MGVVQYLVKVLAEQLLADRRLALEALGAILEDTQYTQYMFYCLGGMELLLSVLRLPVSHLPPCPLPIHPHPFPACPHQVRHLQSRDGLRTTPFTTGFRGFVLP